MHVSDLVDRARSGNKEALIQLVMNAKDDYYRLAYVYLHNKEDSLDALQDMIVIVYENIGELKNPHAFYSWSKTILVNCSKKILRKKSRVTLIDDMQVIDENQTDRSCGYIDTEFESHNSRQDIFRELSKLNPYQQEAIKLRYFLEWDYDHIAEATGVPLGTVKSRISTALTKLRELFGGEY